MDRNELIQKLESSDEWDVIIIGGGATGLGAAVESASRNYKTLLLEQADFAKGTSSRSTKLVHGGVRYLQQGNISLVREALHERGLLFHNAPHLVRNQSFIVPSYKWWEGPFYGVGLKLYDLLAGKLGLGPSKKLSREETLKRLPTIETEGLRGGVIYYDGQFDDARLAINLAESVYDQGGTPINYMKVTDLLQSGGKVKGVKVVDVEADREYQIRSKTVINATGIFADNILNMTDHEEHSTVVLSQGIHLVLDKEFLPGDSAIMVPSTDDGRVLFAIPWYDKVLIGTTDTPVDEPTLEPHALEKEINFILKHAARYLTKDPKREDVKSVFAGLRPLAKPDDAKDTASVSRDHSITVDESGLITVTGGKWTTYRKMGEDTIRKAAELAGLENKNSITENLVIHGGQNYNHTEGVLKYYGSDAAHIKKLIEEQSDWGEKLHERLPYIKAQVIWAVRNEMARTVEDFLARRTRALLLDAKASVEMVPEVARLMAMELNKDAKWHKNQVEAYREVAQNYILDC